MRQASFPLILLAVLSNILITLSDATAATARRRGLDDARPGNLWVFDKRSILNQPALSSKSFMKPSYPLTNGTIWGPSGTSASQTGLTTGSVSRPNSAPSIASGNTTNITMSLVPGYAQFKGTSFRSMCSSTDAACRQMCTAMVSSCTSEHDIYRSNTKSWERSFESKNGNATYPLTTVYETRTGDPTTTSTFSLTLIDRLHTVQEWLRITSTTVVVPNPQCSTSECAENSQNTSSVSKYYNTDPYTTVKTIKDQYAVNGTAWGLRTISGEEYVRTSTREVKNIPPYTGESPSCDFTWFTACQTSPDCNKCTITGGTVELLYFPESRTTGPSNKTAAMTNPAAVSTAVYQNMTMTSPSVYISFETAYAQNDCGSQVGGRYPGAILGIPQSELSSVRGGWGTIYEHAGDPFAPESKTPTLRAGPFTLADLNWPIPVSAYTNQLRFVLGRDVFSVVFDDFSPILAVPTSIRNMDPAWNTCALDWEGLYDPPLALQPTENIATPTRPAEITTSTPAAPALSPTVPARATEAPSPTRPIAGTTMLPSSSSPSAQVSVEDPPPIVSDAEPTSLSDQISHEGESPQFDIGSRETVVQISLLPPDSPAQVPSQSASSVASSTSSGLPLTPIQGEVDLPPPRGTTDGFTEPQPQAKNEVPDDQAPTPSVRPLPNPALTYDPTTTAKNDAGFDDSGRMSTHKPQPGHEPSAEPSLEDGESIITPPTPPADQSGEATRKTSHNEELHKSIISNEETRVDADIDPTTPFAEAMTTNALSVLEEALRTAVPTTPRKVASETQSLIEEGPAATISGQTPSLNANGLVIGASTIPLTPQQTHQGPNRTNPTAATTSTFGNESMSTAPPLPPHPSPTPEHPSDPPPAVSGPQPHPKSGAIFTLGGRTYTAHRIPHPTDPSLLSALVIPVEEQKTTHTLLANAAGESGALSLSGGVVGLAPGGVRIGSVTDEAGVPTVAVGTWGSWGWSGSMSGEKGALETLTGLPEVVVGSGSGSGSASSTEGGVKATGTVGGGDGETVTGDGDAVDEGAGSAEDSGSSRVVKLRAGGLGLLCCAAVLLPLLF